MADADRSRKRGRDRTETRADRRRVAADGRKKRGKVDQDHLPLERANLMLFALALAVIVIGYLTLAAGSITLAPILLVLGYCVLIPVAIVFRPRTRRMADTGAGPLEARPGSGGE